MRFLAGSRPAQYFAEPVSQPPPRLRYVPSSTELPLQLFNAHRYLILHSLNFGEDFRRGSILLFLVVDVLVAPKPKVIASFGNLVPGYTKALLLARPLSLFPFILFPARKYIREVIALALLRCEFR